MNQSYSMPSLTKASSGSMASATGANAESNLLMIITWDCSALQTISGCCPTMPANLRKWLLHGSIQFPMQALRFISTNANRTLLPKVRRYIMTFGLGCRTAYSPASVGFEVLGTACHESLRCVAQTCLHIEAVQDSYQWPSELLDEDCCHKALLVCWLIETDSAATGTIESGTEKDDRKHAKTKRRDEESDAEFHTRRNSVITRVMRRYCVERRTDTWHKYTFNWAGVSVRQGLHILGKSCSTVLVFEDLPYTHASAGRHRRWQWYMRRLHVWRWESEFFNYFRSNILNWQTEASDKLTWQQNLRAWCSWRRKPFALRRLI